MVSTTLESQKHSRIEIVDYLRLVAALSVVMFHYFYAGITNGKIPDAEYISPMSDLVRYGYLGVELFFLISGFVIATSARGRTASRFAVGRLLRLYPAFWVALTVTTIFALVLDPHFMHITVKHVLVNLTMVPNWFGGTFLDGAYWTLGYEISFYLVVFVVLFVGLRERLNLILSIWLVIGSFVTILAPQLISAVPLLGGYFLLFCSGAVISAIRTDGWSIWRGSVLLLGYIASIKFALRNVDFDNAEPGAAQPWPIAIIVTLFFAALLITLIPAVANLKIPGSMLAGQLTYPVYLLHAHIGYMLIGKYSTPANALWVTLAVIALIVVMALALHIIVERKMNPFWFAFFDRTAGVALRFLERVPNRIAKRVRPASRGIATNSSDATN